MLPVILKLLPSKPKVQHKIPDSVDLPSGSVTDVHPTAWTCKIISLFWAPRGQEVSTRHVWHMCVPGASELVWIAEQKRAQQYSHTDVGFLEGKQAGISQPAGSAELLRALPIHRDIEKSSKNSQFLEPLISL